ncbi:MAG: hypothetical protein ACLFQG_04975, partial [Desulfovermiculus sp.]
MATGGEDGALNLKVAVHQGLDQLIHSLAAVIHQVAVAPLAYAGFLAENPISFSNQKNCERSGKVNGKAEESLDKAARKMHMHT